MGVGGKGNRKMLQEGLLNLISLFIMHVTIKLNYWGIWQDIICYLIV
jgi:hypothetical protein